MADQTKVPAAEDTNAAIWKSDEGISYWVATQGERERRRGEHRRMLADLLPFADDEAFSFLDLGAGTGSATATILSRFDQATSVLADFSPQMMEEGQRALAPFAGRYRYVELDLASGQWPDELAGPFDAAVSSLCVHHLPDERKRSLFAEIGERLRPGGWYLNYDPVAADEPLVAEAWERAGDRQDPEAAHTRAHRTPDRQRRWENHVRHISALGPQIEWLRQAGFVGVDVYLKQLDYVIYGGCRPPAAS